MTRFRETIISILAVAVCTVALWLGLSAVQTAYSADQATDRAVTLLINAVLRMRTDNRAADEDEQSFVKEYRAASKTMALSLRGTDPTQSLASLSKVFSTKELAILDSGGSVLNGSLGLDAEELAAAVPEMASDGLIHGDMIYFAEPLLLGRTLVAGWDASSVLQEIEALRSPEHAINAVDIGEEGFIIATDIDSGMVLYAPENAEVIRTGDIYDAVPDARDIVV